VGDRFDDTGAGEDALAKYVTGMAEFEQLAPLDTVWSYNNSAFFLAGYLIETATEMSFEAALKELVLEPLGLVNAFLDPVDVMTLRFAAGHNSGEDGARVATPWPLPRAFCAGGGIICSVRELLRYARFHLRGGKTESGASLLAAKTIARMQAPQATVWKQRTQGVAWAIEETEGVRRISHGGATVGQNAWLLLIPQRDFAIAVLTNSNRGSQVYREVSRWALKHFLDLEPPEPAPIETTVEELSQYVGCYVRPFAEIELGILGRKLVGQLTYKGGFPTSETPPQPAPPPMSLTLCEKDRLLVLDGGMKGSTAEVVRRPDGSIGWLRMGGRVHARKA
jgi:hypothetical protein